MAIYLGNLDVSDIERRAGVDFPKELKAYMKDKRQEEANSIAKGKWHCFDVPFVLVCGDMETASYIHDHLKYMSGDFEECLQIALGDAQ